MNIHRRSLLRGLVAGTAGALAAPGLSTVVGGEALADPADPAEPRRDVRYHEWNAGRGARSFALGVPAGTVLRRDGLSIRRPTGHLTYSDPFRGGTRDYEFATWTSPWVCPGFVATQAVPSWNADTPGGTWVQVQLRGVTSVGDLTTWYNLGRWAADDTEFVRTSVPDQSDASGSVDVDTFMAAADTGLVTWQLRITLLRPAGTTQTPTVRSAGAMLSRLPAPAAYPPSTPLAAQGVTHPVPQYSQQIHVGQYPQWDNGGQAWCSPTSTSMLLAFWGTGPTAEDYAWVDPAYADPWVDHAARHTYDYDYTGCGNWPFNTAYAGRFGLHAFVTRLRSLNEAESFIAAGIPLIVSASFKKGEIPGADYGTNGHLMVIAGFTADGDPVMNDPNAPDNASVRKVFGRAEFEKAWRNTRGGLVYVIHPSNVALPARAAQANW